MRGGGGGESGCQILNYLVQVSPSLPILLNFLKAGNSNCLNFRGGGGCQILIFSHLPLNLDTSNLAESSVSVKSLGDKHQ